MRKLIYAINLSLDGCCDHTKALPYDDIHEYHRQLVLSAGMLLYGRKTYQLMVPFWPDMAKNNSGPSKTMNDFARTFAAVERIVVVSKSLKDAEGEKTTIIRSSLKEEILKLKAEKGKDILVGGVDLPSQLMQLGLIDEYRFVVQPIVAGEGRRLFDDVKQKDLLQLKLVESKTFQSGCVVLSYNSISNNA